MKENGSFSSMNDELNYMNYTTWIIIQNIFLHNSFFFNYTCFCDMHGKFKYSF
jgi:hypothetical protein